MAHNYTSKIKLVSKNDGIHRLCKICDKGLMRYLKADDNNSVINHVANDNVINLVGIVPSDNDNNGNDVCVLNVIHDVGDVSVPYCTLNDTTALPENISNISNYSKFLKLFVQYSTKLDLGSHVLISDHGIPGIWYEDIYDLSKW